MNTSQLKKFAQDARIKLINSVGAKLEEVLTHDSAALRAKANIIERLREDLNKIGREALIDKIAYVWFNRLVALRYMDANDFQPLGVNVLSPVVGKEEGTPQILSDIHAGIFPADLLLDRRYINDVLNGTTPSNNPDNTIFRLVLIAVCNDLHRIFPFLFERIDDYSELLLPDDLTSPFSIVADVQKGMPTEDCKEVEIIGWLYQFYISELNADLISSKAVYKKDEIAPASQLFTPKWIVKYMVDNTLGQLLVEQYPNSKIVDSLEYYIKPDYIASIPQRENRKLEEIQFFEPCVGSGHILSYAFDVFYKAYEEQGYSNTEIPSLILKNNLFGIDIDPRAAQMAALVLMMKGRQRYRRFFRIVEKEKIKPNIYVYQNFAHDEKFNNATVLGSLIRVSEKEADSLAVEVGSLFGEEQQYLKDLYTLLSKKYDVVVTNPPYISSARMEASLKKYVEANWKETKSDLFATFVLRCLELCKPDGFTGYMTPFVWMFISSYEKLREILIDKHLIHSLIQLEYSGFDGATVPICTFTLRNNYIDQAKGSYIKLSDFKGSENQAPKTLEAIENPQCGWFYTANQKNFEKIPGYNIGYWLSEKIMNILNSPDKLTTNYEIGSGLSTSENTRFLRFIWEINLIDINKNTKKINSDRKWSLFQKGGEYRKWYGNLYYVVNWKNDGQEIKEWVVNNPNDPLTTHWSRRIFNTDLYFRQGITWSVISSSEISFRYTSSNAMISNAAGGIFGFEKDEYSLFGLISAINSKIWSKIFSIINPTLNYSAGVIQNAPQPILNSNLSSFGQINVSLSQQEWDSRETSWDFKKNELIRLKIEHDNFGYEDSQVVDLANSKLLSVAFQAYYDYWHEKFFTLHENEEELNRQFIEIYGLQDELTPDVPLENITILKDETVIEDGELLFREDEIIAQLISYAVGCIFGRYSLDKDGLILANQGETLQDYLVRVEKAENELQFVPDADNVVPVLDDEWFDDDIVNRVREFIRTVWGDDHLQDNIQFIEDALGKDLRKYLTKDFYKDHIKRYKKRPIYWMFSSPKGHFNVLIYMHRYTPDTLNMILNAYLRPFMEKVRNDIQRQSDIIITGSAVEQGRARKRQDRLKDILADCEKYEYEILYPLASDRIAIDLDDGVLVNYNKFGNAIAPVAGLNDAKTKNKVKSFDWIDTTAIK